MRYQDCAEQGKVNGLICFNVVAYNCTPISMRKAGFDWIGHWHGVWGCI
jgi:hypothetical protein